MPLDRSQNALRGASTPRIDRSNQSHVVHLGSECVLSCPLCDCRRPSGLSLEHALEEGGARIVLRGAAAEHPQLGAVVRRARARGFAEVVIRTNGLSTMTPEAARALAATGANVALFPMFSASPVAHDRIAGRDRALAHALVGMRALADATMTIELEVPLLSRRLQDLEQIVLLAHRAVPSLRAVRFFISAARVSAALAPPTLTEAGPALAGAIRRCRSLGVAVQLTPDDAVPLCTLRDAPDVQDAHRFNPRAKARRAHGATDVRACESCVVRRQCPGVPEIYRTAHGDRGVVAYTKRPRALYEQRSAGSPIFTAAHRRAASKATIVVLRPTVNCNQDCTFCSANETSGNVWTDSDTMLRAIARSARRGIERLSFGGGEPTLARDLVHYVHAAHRLGVGKVEVVTNGVLLDRPDRVQELKDAGLTHAFVSLHAHDERLSQTLTQKVGDHARTVRAIHNLLDAGVKTSVNHVINARNYPYLTRFVEFIREEFDGRIMISFAFVTPQYKALEDLGQVPRLSDVKPYLHRALHRSIEIGQETVVGSRQGVPPCFLDEFRGWSDVLDLAAEAASEDAPQKQRSPVCDGCRYTRQCTGLWRPYVTRYGLSELSPVPGAPFSDEELEEIRRTPRATRFGGFSKFEGLPLLLRDLASETEGVTRYRATAQPEEPPIRSLPLVTPQRSRPVRVALAGSGRQARRLARAAASSNLSVDAVASPRAPETADGTFGGCPTYRALGDAIADMRPEAVIVAAATHAHLALARAALEAGIPTLLEKPPTRTEAEADELLSVAAAHPEVPVLIAHNMLFAPGLDSVLGARELRRVSVIRKTTATSPEAMRAWSRNALYQSLYHLVALAADACGGGPARIVTAHHHGDVVPERAHVELSFAGGQAEVTLDFCAPTEELSVMRRADGSAPPAASWHRTGSKVVLRRGDREHEVEQRGSDVDGMLCHFRDVALGKIPPRANLGDGADVMRAARAAIDALERGGAPFDRRHGPRHVASPDVIAFPKSRRKAAP